MATSGSNGEEAAYAEGADQRGRDADQPTEIPPTGWKDVLTRVRAEAKDDGVTLMGAGVAFYALLALVPGLVALISIYGLLAEPSDVTEQVTSTLSAAPAEVRELVTAQLEAIVASAGGDAVVGAIIGIVLALWSASSGVGHVIEAINRAYDEKETRGFVRLKVISLALTVGSVLFMVVAFAIVAVLPALLAKTGLGASSRIVVGSLRWVLLLGGMTLGLAVLYRYGPDRDDARWQWVSPGAIVAALMWVLGSMIFSVYTANFASTTRRTDRWAPSSCCCSGCSSPRSWSSSAPRSTANSNVRRRGTAPWGPPDRWAPERDRRRHPRGDGGRGEAGGAPGSRRQASRRVT